MLKLQVVLIPPSALKEQHLQQQQPQALLQSAHVANSFIQSSPYLYPADLGTSTPNTNTVNLTNQPVSPSGYTPIVLRKFLHITNKSKSLLEIVGEIALRFEKLYPDDGPLDIIKLQDVTQCDLDPDYIAGDVFDYDNVVRVLISNELNSDDNYNYYQPNDSSVILNNEGKRRASQIFSGVLPKKRQTGLLRDHNLWRDRNIQGSRRSTPLARQIYPDEDVQDQQNTEGDELHQNRSYRNTSLNTGDTSDVTLPPPGEETRYLDPKKSDTSSIAPSPLPNTSRRITSGMLIAPEPQLQDAEEKTFEEKELNEKITSRIIPIKKPQEDGSKDHLETEMNSIILPKKRNSLRAPSVNQSETVKEVAASPVSKIAKSGDATQVSAETSKKEANPIAAEANARRKTNEASRQSSPEELGSAQETSSINSKQSFSETDGESETDEPQFTKDEIMKIFKNGKLGRLPASVRQKIQSQQKIPKRTSRAAALKAAEKLASHPDEATSDSSESGESSGSSSSDSDSNDIVSSKTDLEASKDGLPKIHSEKLTTDAKVASRMPPVEKLTPREISRPSISSSIISENIITKPPVKSKNFPESVKAIENVPDQKPFPTLESTADELQGKLSGSATKTNKPSADTTTKKPDPLSIQLKANTKSPASNSTQLQNSVSQSQKTSTSPPISYKAPLVNSQQSGATPVKVSRKESVRSVNATETKQSSDTAVEVPNSQPSSQVVPAFHKAPEKSMQNLAYDPVARVRLNVDEFMAQIEREAPGEELPGLREIIERLVRPDIPVEEIRELMKERRKIIYNAKRRYKRKLETRQKAQNKTKEASISDKVNSKGPSTQVTKDEMKKEGESLSEVKASSSGSDSDSDNDSSSSASSSSEESGSEEELNKRPRLVSTPSLSHAKKGSMSLQKSTLIKQSNMGSKSTTSKNLRTTIANIDRKQAAPTSSNRRGSDAGAKSTKVDAGSSTDVTPLSSNKKSRFSLSSLSELIYRGVPDVNDSLTPKSEKPPNVQTKDVESSSEEDVEDDSEDSSSDDSSDDSSSAGDDEKNSNTSNKFLDSKTANNLLGSQKTPTSKRTSSAFKELMRDAKGLKK